MRDVFLDRDGVISENRADHVKSWEEFRFIPGALEAIAWLHQVGFRVFVVTNQAIVNRGVVSAQVIEDIHTQMLWHIVQQGGFIDDILFCPHDYHDECLCRKPRPGMLLQLAAKWAIELSHSYLVGDAWTDIAAGRAVSCRTIMVRTGRGVTQASLPETRQNPADHVADDLRHAVDWILRQEGMVSADHERNGVASRLPSAVGAALAIVG